MKPKWLIGCVIGSLLMNAFFIAGFAYSQFQLSRLGNSMTARQEAVAQRLELTNDQRVRFRQIKQDVDQAVQEYQTHDAKTLEQFWELLAQGSPPPERLEAIFREMAGHQEDYHRRITQHMLRFLAILEPEQQQRFLQFAREKNVFRRLTNRRS